MEENGGETPHILAEPGECPSPELGKLAQEAGMSCQQLFVRSYLQNGQCNSFARAIFAKHLVAVNGARVVPNIVKIYAIKMKKSSRKGKNFRRGFCAGCQLDTEGITSFAFAYSLIHPDSLHADFQANPEVVATDMNTELLYDKLVVSGALDRDEDPFAPAWGDEV